MYISFGIGHICYFISNLIEVISIFVVTHMKLPPSKKQAAHTKAVKEFLRSSCIVTNGSFVVNDLEASEYRMSIKQKVVTNDSESDEDEYNTTFDDYMKEYEGWQEAYEMFG